MSTTLKVMQCNVQHSYGTDNVSNVQRQMNVVASHSPHVVTMNEVFSGMAARYLGDLQIATGKKWYEHYAEDFPGKGEGNVILSVFPFTGSAFHQYKTVLVSGLNETMSAIMNSFKINGLLVNLFSTHFAWNNGAAETAARKEQVGELITWMAAFAGFKLVSGDLNVTAINSDGSLTALINNYTDAWSNALSRSVATAYPDNPVSQYTRTRHTRLDYQFFNTGKGWTVASAQIPDTRVPPLLNPNPKVLEKLGTADDYGVRPSDHNWLVVSYVHA